MFYHHQGCFEGNVEGKEGTNDDGVVAVVVGWRVEGVA